MLIEINNPRYHYFMNGKKLEVMDEDHGCCGSLQHEAHKVVLEGSQDSHGSPEPNQQLLPLQRQTYIH